MNTRAGISVALFFSVLGASRAASAQTDDSADVQRMKDLNLRAIGDVASADFESAKNALVEAIGIGTAAGLNNQPVMAKTYVHLATVYLTGFADEAAAAKYFGMALKIKPDVKLTEAIATDEVKKAFAAAKGGISSPFGSAPPPPAPAPPPPDGGTAADAPPPPVSAPRPRPPGAAPRRPGAAEEPDLPANVPQALFCPNADESPPGTKIVLKCVVQPGVEAFRVLLFFRSAGAETFTVVPMARSPRGWYRGSIAAGAVVGKSLQYYFEARDAADKVSASNGRNDSPNLMLVLRGAQPVGKDAETFVPAAKRSRGGGEKDENPLENINAEHAQQVQTEGRHRRADTGVWFGFEMGTGYGWHTARALEYRDDLDADPGLRPASAFNITPEIGYQLNAEYAVSIVLRFQYIPSSGSGGAQSGGPAKGATAVLVRAFRFYGDRNLQFFIDGFVGGGEGFRLVVPASPDAGLPRNDTVRGGPVVLGPGGGVLYHLGKNVALVAEIKGMMGLPEFAVAADVSGGVQLGF